MNAVITEFLRFREVGIEVFSIVGNHDVAYEKMEYFDRSPLKTLFLSGAIKPLHIIENDKVYIRGPMITQRRSKRLSLRISLGCV